MPSATARSSDRIVGDDLHLQAQRPVGDDGADVAAADDAQRLVEQLHAHEAVLLPLAGAGGGGRLRNLPGQRQHHRERVLGGGDGVAIGRVHHDDAAAGGGGDIDIVDADAGAADDFQVGRGGDDLRRDLGGRTDGEPIIGGDGGEQRLLVLAEIGQVVDVDAAVAENLDSGFGELVGDKNAGGHGGAPYE
jgi:hypothetical protein